MSSSESNLKNNIRNFIQKEGELLKEPEDPNCQFIFVFSYPKGRDPKTGKPIRPQFQLVNPKKGSIQMASRMVFNKKEINTLKSKNQFIKFQQTLRAICLSRDVNHEFLDENSPKIKDGKPSFLISDRLSYPIDHTGFWKTLRHLYFTGLLIAGVIMNFLDKEPSDDKDFSSSPSLYM